MKYLLVILLFITFAEANFICKSCYPKNLKKAMPDIGKVP
jgi:hypothetical protein